MASTPRIVCFDLGGVVVRICRSFEEAVLASGVPLRRSADSAELMARATPLIDAHQIGAIESRAFHAAMSDLLQGMYSPAEFARIHAAVTRDEYEGVEPLIRALNERNVVTACLSNTNAAHWEILVEMPALRAFQHRFASHLFGLMKPDPSIYRRVERELGASAGEIVFFDDVPEFVEAARSVGWDAVLIDYEGDTAQQIETALIARGISCCRDRAAACDSSQDGPARR